jgi:hypothetical protein
MSEFITLPSDASAAEFPHNTNSSFSVRLAKNIRFSSREWEVALKDISFSNNWPNVTEGIITVRVKEVNGALFTFVVKIGTGRYENITEIIERVHSSLQSFRIYPTVGFEYDKTANATAMFIQTDELSISLSTDIAYIFGFVPNQFYEKGKHANVTPPDVARGFTSLYVYSSIVGFRLVGDANVQLLRVVPVSGKKFANVYTEFNQSHYVDVANLATDVVEVLITSDDGERVPFDGGKVILTVHFRKKSIS